MKKRIRDYRALARESMKNSYWLGVLPCLIFYLIYNVLAFIVSLAMIESPVIFFVYYVFVIITGIFVFPPFSVGFSRFCVEQAQGRPDMNNIAYAFKNSYGNVVKVSFIRDLKLIIWCIGLFFAGFILISGITFAAMGLSDGALMDRMRDDTALGMILFAVEYLLILACLIPGLIKAMEYSMIRFILAEKPYIRSKDAFKMTKEMMDSNKWRLFHLGFSFVGWHILATLPSVVITVLAIIYGEGMSWYIYCQFLAVLFSSFGISFVVPYTESAVAHFYLDAKAQVDHDAPAIVEAEDSSENFDNGDTFGL